MKIIEFLTFITAGAVMFSSCSSLTGDDEGADGPGTPGATGLELQVSDMVIQADGKDAAVFTVLSDGKPVSEGVRFYDGATNRQIELPEMAFTTTETGTYTHILGRLWHLPYGNSLGNSNRIPCPGVAG